MGKDGCPWRERWAWLDVVGLENSCPNCPRFWEKRKMGLEQTGLSSIFLVQIVSGLVSGHCVVGWTVRVSGFWVGLLMQACPSVFHLLGQRYWLSVRQWLKLVHKGQAWHFAGRMGRHPIPCALSSEVAKLWFVSLGLPAATVPWKCLSEHEASREDSPLEDGDQVLVYLLYTNSSLSWKQDRPVDFSLMWVCRSPFLVYAFSAFYQSFHPKAFWPRTLACLTSQLGGNWDGVCMKGSKPTAGSGQWSVYSGLGHPHVLLGPVPIGPKQPAFAQESLFLKNRTYQNSWKYWPPG